MHETGDRQRMTASVGSLLDPMQFAYREKRGTEDATISLIHAIAQHLESPGSYARVLFLDYSAAFNTMHTHILIKRMIDLSINGNFIHWIADFLTNRPQRVIMNNIKSEEIVLSTGAPQGCVLSPLLFSIYTNELRVKNDMQCDREAVLNLFKFSDDMALVGLLFKEKVLADSVSYDSSKYLNAAKELELWCKKSYLQLNPSKTKELIVDFNPKPDMCHKPVYVSEKEVEVVDDFVYLGTTIDKKLSFKGNAERIFKKANQRLYLLRKLRSFGVSNKVLQTVYKSLVQSILTFNISVWHNLLNQKDKVMLSRIVNNASKIVGIRQAPLTELYKDSVQRKARKIVRDPSHPLFPSFEVMPSGRRFRAPRWKKVLFKRSFVPSAVSILNSS